MGVVESVKARALRGRAAREGGACGGLAREWAVLGLRHSASRVRVGKSATTPATTPTPCQYSIGRRRNGARPTGRGDGPTHGVRPRQRGGRSPRRPPRPISSRSRGSPRSRCHALPGALPYQSRPHGLAPFTFPPPYVNLGRSGVKYDPAVRPRRGGGLGLTPCAPIDNLNSTHSAFILRVRGRMRISSGIVTAAVAFAHSVHCRSSRQSASWAPNRPDGRSRRGSGNERSAVGISARPGRCAGSMQILDIGGTPMPWPIGPGGAR